VMDFRQLLKTLAYRSGALGGYHQWKNRRELTVAMFHRVLPEGDPEWAAADPAWAVSERLFEQCLQFFASHYNVISFEQLMAARQDASRLPDRSLLITFDDGWADNAQYALSALRKHRLPSVVFVVAGAVNQRELWDERLRYARRRNAIRTAEWQQMAVALQLPTDSLEALIHALAPMEADRREQIVELLVESSDAAPAMLSTQQLRELAAGGVTIGSHGVTHTPVPRSNRPQTEITASRRMLKDMLQDEAQQNVLSISFPHGAYDDACIRYAQQAGYEFLFTSDPHLIPLEAGKPVPKVLGRIHISGPDIMTPSGDLDPAQLALWLFRRTPAQPRAVESVTAVGVVA